MKRAGRAPRRRRAHRALSNPTSLTHATLLIHFTPLGTRHGWGSAPGYAGRVGRSGGAWDSCRYRFALAPLVTRREA